MLETPRLIEPLKSPHVLANPKDPSIAEPTENVLAKRKKSLSDLTQTRESPLILVEPRELPPRVADSNELSPLSKDLRKHPPHLIDPKEPLLAGLAQICGPHAACLPGLVCVYRKPGVAGWCEGEFANEGNDLIIQSVSPLFT